MSASPNDPKATADKLLAKAFGLAKSDDDFLDLAQVLWDLQELDPYMIKDFTDKTGMGRRKVYYLIDIGKAFDNLPIKQERLKNIGWTKLTKIAPHVTKETYEEMLQLAENNKVKDLETRLGGGEVDAKNKRVVVLYFTPEEFEELATVMVAHGAMRSGKGLIDKEPAIMKMVAALSKKPA